MYRNRKRSLKTTLPFSCIRKASATIYCRTLVSRRARNLSRPITPPKDFEGPFTSTRNRWVLLQRHQFMTVMLKQHDFFSFVCFVDYQKLKRIFFLLIFIVVVFFFNWLFFSFRNHWFVQLFLDLISLALNLRMVSSWYILNWTLNINNTQVSLDRSLQ